jgi:hypothetical protein
MKATRRQMTFEQIGEAMGISSQRAHQLYQNGMRKLRRKPKARLVFDVARLLDHTRQERVQDALQQLRSTR